MRAFLLGVLVLVLGCERDHAEPEQHAIRTVFAPRVAEIIESDIDAHRLALEEAATRLAPGFVVEDAAQREREMHAALRIVQSPKKGIKTFVASPMTFLAAVDKAGVVIARDRVDDTMKGKDFANRFPVVKQALAGQAGMELAEFFATGTAAPPSISILFAAPARKGNEIVGAVILGIPLPRLAQRLQRQLRVEQPTQIEKGAAVWVYIAQGERLFHWDTSPRVDEAVPSAAERAKGLGSSPNGYTGVMDVAGHAFGYGVFSASSSLAPDLQVLVVYTAS